AGLPGPPVDSEAYLLTEDNRVVFPWTSTGYTADLPISAGAGSYYVAVYHRNHVPLISKTPIDFSVGVPEVDFANSFSPSFTEPFAPLMRRDRGFFPRYTIRGGDADADGLVSADDVLTAWQAQRNQTGYLSADFNLDGVVDEEDLQLIWLPSHGAGF
ncbi:MAG: hypothetical protein AAF752_16105, partial [Bacteroidota bacterium]